MNRPQYGTREHVSWAMDAERSIRQSLHRIAVGANVPRMRLGSGQHHRRGLLLAFIVLAAVSAAAEAAPNRMSAALRGNREAIRDVAEQLAKSPPRHFPQASRLRPHLRNEALLGSGAAAEAYGMFLQYGIGGPAKPGEAVTWYRRSAQRGDQTAGQRAALALALGWGVRRDTSAARRLLAQLDSERRARVMLQIGQALLAPGRAEPAVAARWLAEAATLGTASSVRASKIYEEIGPSDASDDVLQWLQTAARAGNQGATFELARRFSTAADPSRKLEAADLYLKSAKAGDERAVPALQSLLGASLENLDDPVVAFLVQRAEQGSSAARFVLGKAYLFRAGLDGAARDKARHYLALAARDGIADAQYQLGMLEIANGDAGRENLARAYLSLASQAGHPLASQAILQIGEMPADEARLVALLGNRQPRPRPGIETNLPGLSPREQSAL